MPGNSLPRIVVLGAGLGGTIAAYEIRDATKGRAEVTVVSDSEDYWFVPSNPWVAVRWREPEAIRVPLAPVMAKKGIGFTSVGALRVHPQDQRIDLRDGTSITYDWLVIATGPELAFDEIPGFGPQGYTVSVCRTDHAAHAADAFDAFCADPKPIVVGAAQGASCFGPAYEFALILDTELRRRKIRDRVPMTFVTSEPYIGHLGLDGVGDTKGLLESEMRERHIKWITNARVASIEPGMMHVEEVGEDGAVKKAHDLPFGYSMLLPAFRGVEAVHGIEGLTNPRGFILADRHQRNPTFKNIYSLGVCVAIPPIGPTPVPVGVPKTGFMIESMVTAVAHNIASELDGREPDEVPSWNAVCLADFGDGGVAFVAQPQIPPRNVNWSSHGKWVHLAKVGFEKYFLHKVRSGTSEPLYEKLALNVLGISKLKETTKESVR
ncbi:MULTISPECIES: NAD(P)/FAD-dependent oxidoreductase [unclassified Novosphingobium]|uniref:NAD(P)/FAD-dependent oxidoreductase n=1 Tax=unclassified Novosphingobium TaxID=2644732 RepID=UPI00086BD4E7|nr:MULTISPECIES: FAD/NAD(P)-binding oxidoreductase [unclassified Novosphingobium]MBN9144584.1 NAD(P)/FAD-dependent oxidoreductase [Novosphingobium sp.]MDR6707916.1 sulfide:quinone oxidoreductase [Novosphingobium sp. 1748]ODU78774.1 MAG: pyridine nucleotide-disulfide oxidoreductase [Novosphingobium sp. SCN 63-17]OJX93676.1 MAG: pyridine nucleotide-disulfide oxidoreductase [Novosphingobium sp. 63-713]